MSKEPQEFLARPTQTNRIRFSLNKRFNEREGRKKGKDRALAAFTVPFQSGKRERERIIRRRRGRDSGRRLPSIQKASLHSLTNLRFLE
ncbi:hypothetical protein CKAN_00142300 [Cinnamomum micranthum f. kanehirae]|uniref:Uncharacterized protein n=1 Tax=Cinnamomum micranthum f. kanehirae TaxID=337451 RepID=A0A3S3NQD9_9MAGN|nr:hypothetical protein CKAN_00142300 [Cinnamomum micranthum f. kanehirae]